MGFVTRGLVGVSIVGLVMAGPASAQNVCDGVSQTQNTALSGVTVATGLTGRPLLVTAPPGDTDRIFIVEQDGFIWVKHRGTAPSDRILFLDVSGLVETGGNEQGLLGLAFDPDYANNGFFYINYTRSIAWNTIVTRYKVSANPDVADSGSGLILISFAQPESNHNGGNLEFGPDGYLYISTGDGGGGGDVHGTCGNGQNTSTLLGKLLRIDPHASAGSLPADCGGGAHTVPADNPLADGAGGDCDEIWAYGLRNPWRYSFDAANGDLYIADVGQNCWEEIDYEPAGGPGGLNYGWRQMEGAHCYNSVGGCNPTGVACGSSPPCFDPSLVLPVAEYSSAGSSPCSITGGYVYRGCRMTNFQGLYFYGDYCDGSIRSLQVVGGVATNLQQWQSQVDPTSSLAFGLTSFGRDARGELYAVDRSPGSVMKIMPPFPDLEVSGNGAADQLLLNRSGDWSWEDLAYETMHPTDYYRVYRGTPGGAFSCIHSTLTPDWVDGDVADPASGDLYAYVVTAVSGAEESSSGDPPRMLTGPCGPP